GAQRNSSSSAIDASPAERDCSDSGPLRRTRTAEDTTSTLSSASKMNFRKMKSKNYVVGGSSSSTCRPAPFQHLTYRHDNESESTVTTSSPNLPFGDHRIAASSNDETRSGYATSCSPDLDLELVQQSGGIPLDLVDEVSRTGNIDHDNESIPTGDRKREVLHSRTNDADDGLQLHFQEGNNLRNAPTSPSHEEQRGVYLTRSRRQKFTGNGPQKQRFEEVFRDSLPQEPSVQNIERWLLEMTQRCCFSLTSIVGAVVYVSRLLREGKIEFRECSWPTIWCWIMIISEKYWEDNYIHPGHVIQMFGMQTHQKEGKRTALQMQLWLLDALGWDLNVSDEEYDQAIFELRALVEEDVKPSGAARIFIDRPFPKAKSIPADLGMSTLRKTASHMHACASSSRKIDHVGGQKIFSGRQQRPLQFNGPGHPSGGSHHRPGSSGAPRPGHFHEQSTRGGLGPAGQVNMIPASAGIPQTSSAHQAQLHQQHPYLRALDPYNLHMQHQQQYFHQHHQANAG
ncbi:unnamed protein product, partial [Amoebophrya sp. A25]